MKLFHILLLLIAFQSVSCATIEKNMILREDMNRCIYNDYYYDITSSGKKFHYRYAGNTNFTSTTSTKKQRYLHIGFVYDTDTKVCKPDDWLVLGMDIKDFNFLLGLIGVIIGGIFMFFTVKIFMIVGGKR